MRKKLWAAFALALIAVAGTASAISVCHDSDGGRDYFERGTTTRGHDSQTDYCTSSHYLKEYYCHDNDIRSVYRECSYRCVAGACQVEVTPSPTPEPTPEPTAEPTVTPIPTAEPTPTITPPQRVGTGVNICWWGPVQWGWPKADVWFKLFCGGTGGVYEPMCTANSSRAIETGLPVCTKQCKQAECKNK